MGRIRISYINDIFILVLLINFPNTDVCQREQYSYAIIPQLDNIMITIKKNCQSAGQRPKNEHITLCTCVMCNGMQD